MNNKEVLEQLTLIFHKVFNDEDIIMSMDLTSDDIDGWSSISQMLMVAEIEKSFDIKFKLIDIATMNSVADIVNHIQAKLK